MITSSYLASLSSIELSKLALAVAFDRSISDETVDLIAAEIERREHMAEENY